MKTQSSTPLIVGGALTALVALAALAGAAGLLWVHVAKNDQGYLTTGSHRVQTHSRALVSNTFTVNSAGLDHFTFALTSPQTNGFAFSGVNTLRAAYRLARQLVIDIASK